MNTFCRAFTGLNLLGWGYVGGKFAYHATTTPIGPFEVHRKINGQRMGSIEAIPRQPLWTTVRHQPDALNQYMPGVPGSSDVREIEVRRAPSAAPLSAREAFFEDVMLSMICSEALELARKREHGSISIHGFKLQGTTAPAAPTQTITTSTASTTMPTTTGDAALRAVTAEEKKLLI